MKAAEWNPGSFSETIALASGQQIVVRPLRQDDSLLLADYFVTLSCETRKWFAPHAFTADEAQRLCAEIDYSRTIRLLGVSDSVLGPKIMAYFIIDLESKADAERYRKYGMILCPASVFSVAPSVADAYQSCGVGTLLMTKALALGRRLGRHQVVLYGGVQATNLRAQRFYRKFGFRRTGSFVTTVDNYDMILELYP